jgi:hypothetical protein
MKNAVAVTISTSKKDFSFLRAVKIGLASLSMKNPEIYGNSTEDRDSFISILSKEYRSMLTTEENAKFI